MPDRKLKIGRNDREARKRRAAERKHEEQGIWKDYVRLMFKAKLPWLWLGLLVALNIGQASLMLAFPQYAEKITSGVLTNVVIFGAVAVIVADVLASGIIRYIQKITMFKIDMRYRHLIWNRLMRSPIRLYDEVKPSELVSRTANDTSTISAVIAGLMPGLVSMVYSTVMIINILQGYDWRMTLGLLLYTPVYVAAMIWYGKLNYRTNKQTHNRLASLTQFLSELLVNIPLIKSFANEEKETERGSENLESYYRASKKRTIVNWMNVPMTSILMLVMDLFVILFGIYLVSTGAITISVWIAFFMYVGMYFGILETFANMFIQLKQSQGATARIAKLVEGELEQYERIRPVGAERGDIRFEGVGFGYPDEARPVLKSLDFTIPYGQTTAIIGPSGSGKSTTLALIQQLYEPTEGRITFAGNPIGEYHLDGWRNLFSYVAQDSPLFAGTIRENILYGVGREVSEFELAEAAKAANALGFILEFPDGFETDVGESGSNLSGGQRQRVAIARAILRDSEILLLDEATASLDGQSEMLVQQAIGGLMKEKTAIVIAHDLATIRDSGQIILLDGSGEVDLIGTHEQLLAGSARYREFVRYLTEPSAG